MAGMIAAVVRRFSRMQAGAERDFRLTGLESLAIAQTEMEYTELARAGRLFHGGNQIIANGIAPVAAIPTSTATLALFNGEAFGSGKSYAIHKVGFWLGSGTTAAGATLFATVSPQKIAAPPTTNATGYGSQSSSGSSQATKALWSTGVTIPNGSNNAAPAWLAVQSTLQPAAANVGMGDMWVELKGMLVVPPQYALGFGILSGAGTTPLYGISASWAELELDLE